MYAVYLYMTDNGIIMYHKSINIFILPGNNNTVDSFNVYILLWQLSKVDVNISLIRFHSL